MHNTKYVWTKKAEDMAKELNLEERKEGQEAKMGYSTLKYGQTACSWYAKGYIAIVEE